MYHDTNLCPKQSNVDATERASSSLILAVKMFSPVCTISRAAYPSQLRGYKGTCILSLRSRRLCFQPSSLICIVSPAIYLLQLCRCKQIRLFSLSHHLPSSQPLKSSCFPNHQTAAKIWRMLICNSTKAVWRRRYVLSNAVWIKG